MEEKKAKMLKFIMGKGHQPSAERLKVQKELFGFNRVRISLANLAFFVIYDLPVCNIFMATSEFSKLSKLKIEYLF